ncbi:MULTISPECIES: nitroreductase family protein [Thermococcus]|uniref:NAD(P)H-flavin oxidoreductase n=2 Tax=Thermococcus sibiricus TaxID=172049 RepID=C6A3C0_THESM|nr:MULTISPECIES: nitroreductase family protein [Thermococcus]ACS90115.1 NAD(P)H-flavin oxidoreductase [Thermococcus sibiricus MM 739]MBC7094954.1 nitroreductase family protein [Thermococcus sp.]
MIQNLAKRRKTVRKFKKEKPPIEKILKIIEAAKEAPSGMNAQPWHFIIIETPERKREIRGLCEEGEKKFYEKMKGKLGKWLQDKGFTWKKPFLSDAPYLLLVFTDVRAPFAVQATWLAIGYLLLALEEEGLGTVTYTPPNPREIEELVNAPKHYKLQTILPVGYPNDEKPKYERKALEDVISFEKFEKNEY